VLSACDPDVTSPNTVPAEYIGAPAALLEPGAKAVVGSLWSVDDISTDLAIERFYSCTLPRRNCRFRPGQGSALAARGDCTEIALPFRR
jgi:CHAT domain-containing protein